MEQIALIVAMVSFGLSCAIFIGNVLSKGISKALKLGRASTKVAFTCFFVYVVSFAGFLILGNG